MGTMEQDRSRNGFVTFWLRLGLILNIIAPIVSIFTYQNSKNLGETGMSLIIAGIDVEPAVDTIAKIYTFMQIGSVLFAIGMVIGYKKLLDWKRVGFVVICLIAFVSGIFNILCMMKLEDAFNSIFISMYSRQTMIMTAVGPILSVIVLWTILQIKKKSVSCWKLLG